MSQLLPHPSPAAQITHYDIHRETLLGLLIKFCTENTSKELRHRGERVRAALLHLKYQLAVRGAIRKHSKASRQKGISMRIKATFRAWTQTISELIPLGGLLLPA